MKNNNTLPKITPPTMGTSDLFWLYRQKPILALHVLGAVIAFLVPMDVFALVPLTRGFVETVNSFFPIVCNFAIRSKFPEVTQLYGAVMVVTTPYWLLIWSRWPYMEKQMTYMIQLMHASLWKVIVMPVIPFAGVLMTYFFLFVDIQLTEYKTIPFHSSRWALALFGPVLYCWVPVTGLGIAFLTANVFRRYLKGE